MQKINHVGIAVSDLKSAVVIYETILGKIEIEYEEVPSQKVKVAMIPLGESRIELLEPTSPDSPIAKFIDKKGQGIHHICVEVEGLESVLKNLEDNGYQLIDREPKMGAEEMKIAFVHPKALGEFYWNCVRKIEKHLRRGRKSLCI